MDYVDRKTRAWIEINLDNLIFNFKQIKNKLGVKVLAVIKTDAYGQGAVPIARTLVEEGVDYFAVATVEEAFQLRNAGIKTPILILGIVNSSDVCELAKQDITLTVNCIEIAQMYAEYVMQPLKVHIKLDTGLARLGFDCLSEVTKAGEEILEVANISGLIIEGIYTHLASADVEEEECFNQNQIRLFTEATEYLDNHGLEIPIKHCIASAGILRYQEAKFDMVRPGLLLHGIPCEPWMTGLGGIELKPITQIRTRITQIKTIEPNTKVGYGCTWEANKQCTLATIPFGYSDGLYRANAGKFSPLLHGKRVQQVGRICMDMCMLDITGIDAKVGDVVTIYGKDGNDEVVLDEMIRHVPTCHDDFLSALGKRVPRIYYKNGMAIDRLEYLV